MTTLQVLNSLFYLLVYPFLIRTLGAESYGLYVFALSVATFFIIFITYGFEWVAVKEISQKADSKRAKELILSKVFWAKLYLLIPAVVFFLALLITVPKFQSGWYIYAICFLTVAVNIIFPVWYFQGMQRMKVVTFIQLAFKLLSLPFIFIFITGPKDSWIFALIVSLSGLFGGVVAACIIRFVDRLKIRFIPLRKLKKLYKECFPIFLSSSAGVFKQQGATVLIGAFFGMAEVAIYDLAVKIMIVPQTLTSSINSAIFPKIARNPVAKTIKKIISYEFFLALVIIALIAVFGKLAILLLGGEQMLASYPILVALSFTMIPWMVVIAYTLFVFVQQNKYYYITKNQLISASVFFLLSIASIMFCRNIIFIALATTIAGLSEVVYFIYISKKYKLLPH